MELSAAGRPEKRCTRATTLRSRPSWLSTWSIPLSVVPAAETVVWDRRVNSSSIWGAGRISEVMLTRRVAVRASPPAVRKAVSRLSYRLPRNSPCQLRGAVDP